MNEQLVNGVVARRYWENPPGDNGDWFGVSPIGECGQTEVYYRHYEELRHIKRIVNFSKEKTVLELGSGAGRWVLSLAPLVKSYIAVDSSYRMLEIAKCRVDTMNLTNVIFKQCSLQEFIPMGKFDIIYLSGVSQYLNDEDLDLFLQRLKFSLEPSGILIDRSTVHRRSRANLETDDYFSVYRTSEEIIQIFQKHGLINYYHRQSYKCLSVPERLRRWIATNTFANITRRLAPVSYHLLRSIVFVLPTSFTSKREMHDFSHDFFLFRRDFAERNA